MPFAMPMMFTQREVVAGGADCQYLALIAAGTEKGLQLGSMLEVRVLVHQTMTADPERGSVLGLCGQGFAAWHMGR